MRRERTPPMPVAPEGKPGKPGKPPRPVVRSRLANEVRIIGGLWKRSKLPVADKPGLRPTPDRVRETLFNWLGQDLSQWRCIDMFAGTGALGFEAASRGATDVRMFEHDAALVEQLELIKKRLGAEAVRIVRGDGISGARAMPGAGAHAIFIDPPFSDELVERALAAAAPALAPGGFVYLESPAAWTDEKLAPFSLKVHRHLKAGAVHAHLLVALDPPTA